MASKTNKRPGGSKSSRSNKSAKTVTSGTLIASIIAAFLVGYVVSAFVGGFRSSAGSREVSGGSGAPLFQEAPSRTEYIEELEKRTSQDPDDEAIWRELGNAYFDRDQYREAIAAYQRSLEIDPGNPNVWTDMGIMYRRIEEPRKAIDAFDRAVAEDPSHQMSRFNRGIVLFYDLDDRVGAFQSWDELDKLNPNFRTPTGQTINQMMNGLR
jgi:cytochrome c-type biogenesis protein CcmH/NrfG